jgi:hypothetical protein
LAAIVAFVLAVGESEVRAIALLILVEETIAAAEEANWCAWIEEVFGLAEAGTPFDRAAFVFWVRADFNLFRVDADGLVGDETDAQLIVFAGGAVVAGHPWQGQAA